MKIRRVINVLLGSSLPFMGGGDGMTKFEKFYLIILALELLIHFIDILK